MKSCVTTAGTFNEFDVQNKLGRKHTHTQHILCRWFTTTLRKHHSKRTQHARGQAVMDGDDNLGGANNDVVGGGALSGAATDPSAPSDGAAAAAGGGGVVDNSSPVVEDGNGFTATTQTVYSKNGTPVTVKIVTTAAGNRAKRSWIWQVMQEFKPSINVENVICSACEHLMSWVSTSGTTSMTQHYGKNHPALYAQIMKKHTTLANAKANASAAIGELIVVYCWLVL